MKAALLPRSVICRTASVSSALDSGTFSPWMRRSTAMGSTFGGFVSGVIGTDRSVCHQRSTGWSTGMSAAAMARAARGSPPAVSRTARGVVHRDQQAVGADEAAAADGEHARVVVDAG
jgi:hypothetical protein